MSKYRFYKPTYKPVSLQTLNRSYFLGQLACAEGRGAAPDLDPRMSEVLAATKIQHPELIDHIRAWSDGWHEASKIQAEIHVSERIPDFTQAPKPEPSPKPRRYRFPD